MKTFVGRAVGVLLITGLLSACSGGTSTKAGQAADTTAEAQASTSATAAADLAAQQAAAAKAETDRQAAAAQAAAAEQQVARELAAQQAASAKATADRVAAEKAAAVRAAAEKAAAAKAAAGNGVSIAAVQREAKRQWNQAYSLTSRATDATCKAEGGANLKDLPVGQTFTCDVAGSDGTQTNGFGTITRRPPFFTFTLLTD